MFDYWQKQTVEPLFPKALWSRPERKDSAGSLAIVGGNAHAINAPSSSYAYALQTGIGSVRVLLPDKTKKLFTSHTPAEIAFVKSTPTGSFAKDAFRESATIFQALDCTLLVGDFSRNSETAVFLERIASLSGNQTYTGDALEYFDHQPQHIYKREHTLIVPTFAQLQKQAANLKIYPAIRHEMGLVAYSGFLHEFTSRQPVQIITVYDKYLIAAYQGKVCTTKLPTDEPQNLVQVATVSSIWLLWLQRSHYEALVTACFTLGYPKSSLIV